jgi:hypothetical protein
MIPLEAGCHLFFVSFFDGIIQPWQGVLAHWWCGCQGIWMDLRAACLSCAAQFNQEASFVCDWLFSKPSPPQSWVHVAKRVGGIPNRACGRSHAHIPPATCTRGAHVPSRWGLWYKQDLCPVSMTLAECHQLPSDHRLRLLGAVLKVPIVVFPRRLTRRHISANLAHHDTAWLLQV